MKQDIKPLSLLLQNFQIKAAISNWSICKYNVTNCHTLNMSTWTHSSISDCTVTGHPAKRWKCLINSFLQWNEFLFQWSQIVEQSNIFASCSNTTRLSASSQKSCIQHQWPTQCVALHASSYYANLLWSLSYGHWS